MRRSTARRHMSAQSVVLLAFLLAPHAAVAQVKPVVATAGVAIEDVSPRYEFVGRVEAVNSVAIRSRIDGFLASRMFAEGEVVRKDQELFTIESTAYEIALKEAQATLLSARASRTEADRRLQRNRSLNRQTVSQAVLEESETARETAQANFLSAEAGVSRAELNLGYTRISSPIDGRIGLSAFTVGSLVGPSSGALATVVQTDPVRAVFSVTDRSILDLRSAAGGASKEQLASGFAISLRLSNGAEYPERGQIEFFENEIDIQTGTLPIRALFANPEGLLVPGQFVTIIVRQADPRPRPVVPVAAVQQDRDGRYVLLVGGDSKVELRRVEVSGQSGPNWIVVGGLDGEEKVIVEGLQNISPGVEVEARQEPSPLPSQAGNSSAPVSGSRP